MHIEEWIGEHRGFARGYLNFPDDTTKGDIRKRIATLQKQVAVYKADVLRTVARKIHGWDEEGRNP